VEALTACSPTARAPPVRRGAPLPDVPALRRLQDEVLPAVRRARDAGVPLRRDVRKDSSGYAARRVGRLGRPVDLLVGSEGSLAVFTAVQLSLAPAPARTASLLGAFASLEQAVEAAGRARDAGAAACELLDRTFLEVAAEGGAWRRAPAPRPCCWPSSRATATRRCATRRRRSGAPSSTPARAR
jgi:FAD/FMN-containing dehydrogenase